MKSSWPEAVQVNQQIIELFPDDAEAYNRLGRALMELGRYEEARDAYARALELDPFNTIASKNLQRLSKLVDQAQSTTGAPAALDPSLFIEESGKTAVTTLVHQAGLEVLAKLNTGDLLELSIERSQVRLLDAQGQVVGRVEPKLAARVKKLLEAGNRYSAHITSVDEQAVRVILREAYRHPAMSGRPSFPATAPVETVRGYIKSGVLKYDLEEEEDEEEEEGLEVEETEPSLERELELVDPVAETGALDDEVD